LYLILLGEVTEYGRAKRKDTEKIYKKKKGGVIATVYNI
jgi:hypothetical protein